MKKFLLVFSSAAIMVACGNNPEAGTASFSVSPAQQQAPASPDTVGLAQFQQWKAQKVQEAIEENNLPVEEAAPAPVAKVRKAAAPVRKTPRAVAPAPAPVDNSNSTPSVSTGSEDVVINSESGNEAKAEEKKGWSKAAKGTAIGAGTGAVVGAVIGKKNRVVGGVIGGVVGGAVGYGIGKVLDKKDGR